MPSLTYCSVSSTTIPDPLSALLIIRVWSEASCSRASFCVGVRFGFTLRVCRESISVLTLLLLLGKLRGVTRCFFSEGVWLSGRLVSEEVFYSIASVKIVIRL